MMLPSKDFYEKNSIIDTLKGFPCGSAGKESTCNAGDLGLFDLCVEVPSRLQSMGLQRVGHDGATNIFVFFFHTQTYLSDKICPWFC